MSDIALCKKKFDELKVCVIIPTHNNALTLEGVLTSVLQYTDHVIVVNDGSTDNTTEIIKRFPAVELITYPNNMGKGWALRRAFEHAVSCGYNYAITIDSDGQHFAKDLPLFIDKLEQERESIIIGARNMEQASVPGKSSFGYKFSNFWFKIETGIDCPDTQSGYRLYPLQLIRNIIFFTRKYEFEIEVLVRSVWRGVKIDSVPVTVYYAPKETRVSHFRPFRDFSRVGILNTVLVIIAFAWIKPRDFFRMLFNKKKSKQELIGQLFSLQQSDQIKSASIGFGIFMGIIPLWGFQMLIALSVAVFFKLNKALVIIASNISIPPMIPLLIFLSYKSGALWMGSKQATIAFTSKLSLKSIGAHLEQYIYGSITLAVIAGLLGMLITYVSLKLLKSRSVAAF